MKDFKEAILLFAVIYVWSSWPLASVCFKMSSFTVSINGNSSTLRTTLFPHITLRKDVQWEVALLDFTSYNSIPNVTENTNNQLHFYTGKNDDGKLIGMRVAKLRTGSYEIDEINYELRRQLGVENIEIRANNSLLRAEIKSKLYIDFSQNCSLGSLLGFPSSTGILPPNKFYIGKDNVNIMKVNTINITCNLIYGSYKDGHNEHILHTFYPTVPPGFKIVEKPHNLVYLPLSVTNISDIELNVLDQDGNFVDFRGEILSVRLHIRPSF